MSYKNCPRSIRDINENISVCKELVAGLEKRERQINTEITTHPGRESSKLNAELVRIKEQKTQWNDRCSENLAHLDALRKA